MSLGPTEILIVLFVALIVLGPDQLPRAARQLGRAIAEVKKFSSGVQTQVNEVLDLEDEKDKKAGPATPAGPSENPANPDTEGFRLIDKSGTSVPDPPPPPSPEGNGHDPKPAE